jgi:hypothetical protein
MRRFLGATHWVRTNTEVDHYNSLEPSSSAEKEKENEDSLSAKFIASIIGSDAKCFSQ